jgi:hypothetical protein
VLAPHQPFSTIHHHQAVQRESSHPRPWLSFELLRKPREARKLRTDGYGLTIPTTRLVINMLYLQGINMPLEWAAKVLISWNGP